MESKTYIKNLRMTPKKLRFLLPELKRLTPLQSIDYLLYTPKKPAKMFLKVIKSALNNAKNTLKIDEKLLKFKLLTVEEGQKLKRYKPGGRGTPKPIMRRFSHIRIILEAEAQKVLPEVEKAKKSPVTIKSKVKIKK